MNYRHALWLSAAAVLVILTLAIGTVANAAGLSLPGMDRIPVPGKDLQVLPDAAIDALANDL
jgi:hypothetical protein